MPPPISCVSVGGWRCHGRSRRFVCSRRCFGRGISCWRIRRWCGLGLICGGCCWCCGIRCRGGNRLAVTGGRCVIGQCRRTCFAALVVGSRADLVQYRAARGVLRCNDGQRQRRDDKPGCQNPGQARQSIGSLPSSHDATAATTTKAQPTAFRALQQHDANQQQRKDQVNSQDDVFQDSGLSVTDGPI